jgi:hypothetical protein
MFSAYPQTEVETPSVKIIGAHRIILYRKAWYGFKLTAVAQIQSILQQGNYHSSTSHKYHILDYIGIMKFFKP